MGKVWDDVERWLLEELKDVGVEEAKKAFSNILQDIKERENIEGVEEDQ